MEVIIAPDVFVNASVALGSPPEHVVRRILGGKSKAKTSEWVLGRVEAMLNALPNFRKEAVGAQMATIRGLVDIVESADHDPTDWIESLVATAKAAGVKRVITDHPDLADKTEVDGIEFITSDGWLVEVTTPPPPPPPGR